LTKEGVHNKEGIKIILGKIEYLLNSRPTKKYNETDRDNLDDQIQNVIPHHLAVG